MRLGGESIEVSPGKYFAQYECMGDSQWMEVIDDSQMMNSQMMERW